MQHIENMEKVESDDEHMDMLEIDEPPNRTGQDRNTSETESVKTDTASQHNNDPDFDGREVDLCGEPSNGRLERRKQSATAGTTTFTSTPPSQASSSNTAHRRRLTARKRRPTIVRGHPSQKRHLHIIELLKIIFTEHESKAATSVERPRISSSLLHNLVLAKAQLMDQQFTTCRSKTGLDIIKNTLDVMTVPGFFDDTLDVIQTIEQLEKANRLT